MEGETCFYTFVKTKLSVVYTALPSRHGPPAQEGDHVQEDESQPLSGPPSSAPFPERPFLPMPEDIVHGAVGVFTSAPPPATHVPTWVDFKVDFSL